MLARIVQARRDLADYLGAIVNARRQTPGRDLLSSLIQAEEDGGRLTDDELLSTAILLLVAGNETTTNLIGNGMFALLRHTDELRRVWSDVSLVPRAVEEMLRYDSPVQLTDRGRDHCTPRAFTVLRVRAVRPLWLRLNPVAYARFLLSQLGSEFGAEIFRFEDLANLNLGVCKRRSLQPFNRFIQRPAFPQP